MSALLGLGGLPISLLICGLATLMTWALTGAARLRSREEEQLADALLRSRHPKHTDIVTRCPGCGRESHRVIDFCPDLGKQYLVEKHCGPCAHPRAKRTINFDTMTPADIRGALDPECHEGHVQSL